MVRKLIKHELISMFRVAVVAMIVMILLAIISRLSLINYTGDNDMPITFIFLYIVAFFATLGVCFFIGISRFFKTLFTGEGYMTLSLPVSADQLIWSKLLAAIICEFAGVIVCALSVGILFIGLPQEVYAEIKTSVSLMAQVIGWSIKGNELLVAEWVIFGIVSIPAGFLEFYFVMSIGQLFTVKNRKVVAIALYIGIAFIWGLMQEYFVDDLLDQIATISVHLKMWVQIIFVLLVAVICYFVVRYILKNKVNLVA